MTTGVYLASAAVMGTLAVGVAGVLAYGRDWHRYAPARRDQSGLSSRLVRDSRSWLFGFVILGIGALAGTLFALEGGSMTLVLLGVGAIVAGFLAAGVYITATSRGHPHSHAVGEAVITLGALGLAAVVLRLILTTGA